MTTYNTGSRSGTLAQKFGFQDKDLATPAHDTLLFWLNENIDSILLKKYKFFRQRYHSMRYSFGTVYHDEIPAMNLYQYDLSFANKYPLGEVMLKVEKVWEAPIVNKSYTIGFCDMRLDVSVTYPNGIIYFDADTKEFKRVEDQKYFVNLYMEIKPTIPSVGELIRQLRMYQTYTGNSEWYVVSPDTRFRDAIEGQDFGFIEAPSLS